MIFTSLLKKFGWKPDVPDHRDQYFESPFVPTSLPHWVDLSCKFPSPPYEQGDLGSCAANAVTAAIQFDQIRQNLPVVIPSRLFIYYNGRSIENTTMHDAGVTMRNCIKAVNKWGVCPEADWAYDQTKFATKPPKVCYRIAENHKALYYERLRQDLNSFRGCLAAGFPFVFGFGVYESFRSESVEETGVVPVPALTESLLGGHAVVACGYNDSDETIKGIPPKHVLVRNSAGEHWGAAGYFFLPYEYITNNGLADDFWVITGVE